MVIQSWKYLKNIGWGTIYFGGPTSSVLQEVNVRVWDNKQCATNYGRLNRKITDTMMCAGERGRDACQVRMQNSSTNSDF